jgi:excisionase family DNA binding protein
VTLDSLTFRPYSLLAAFQRHGLTVQASTVSKETRKMTEGRLYRLRDVALMFGVCERTIRNWVRDDRLKAVKVARTVRIPSRAVHELLNPPERLAS